ncbi:MAG: toll/interleukin-1 receptor domain-containing protein, partial [Pseudonocardiaceae bacterium]
MARVFVSHASADLALACEVHGWLVEAGHEVFLDRDPRNGLIVGEQWEQRLYERLRWADAVVCVVTSAHLDSVIAGLLRLVTVDEQGRPTRWRTHRGELPDHVCTELD